MITLVCAVSAAASRTSTCRRSAASKPARLRSIESMESPSSGGASSFGTFFFCEKGHVDRAPPMRPLDPDLTIACLRSMSRLGRSGFGRSHVTYMNDNASLALGGNRSGLGGLPQRLVQDGVVEEAAMLTALQAAKDRKSSFVTQLISAGAAKARDIADRRLDRVRRTAVRPRLAPGRPRHRQARAGQAPAEASLPAAVSPRQASVPGRRGSDQPARHRRDQVPDRPRHRGRRRRRRQAAEGSSTRPSSRPTRRCRSSPTTKPDSISRTSTSPAATTTWKARASPATTSKTRPSCASSTNYCSMPSAAARRTSTSSRTKRCTASVCASTAC